MSEEVERLQHLARGASTATPRKASVDDLTDAMRHVTMSERKRLREKNETEPMLVESPSKRPAANNLPSWLSTAAQNYANTSTASPTGSTQASRPGASTMSYAKNAALL